MTWFSVEQECLSDEKQQSRELIHSSTEVTRLKKVLRIQNEKYDMLLRAKEAAEKKYKADYKKWRSFKKWMLGQSDHEKSLREGLEEYQLDLSFGSSPFPSSAGSRRSPFDSKPHAGPSRILTSRARTECSLSDSEGVLPQRPSI